MEDYCSWFCLISITELCAYAIFMIANIYTVGYGYRLLHSYRRPSNESEKDYPPISIIKPIIGYDENMKENLRSFFQLDYPNFELLVCIAEMSNEPLMKIVKELEAEFTSVEVTVFQGGEHVGVNPKINNMLPGYRKAHHDLLWISDSNIKVPPYVLREMVGHLKDPQVGLVHQLPYIEGNIDCFASYLEMVYFSTQHARAYLIASWVGANCANGMSWLVKKKALQDVGDIQSFSEYLAEDFFIGKALWTNNWKFVLSSIPARQNSSVHTLSNYQARIVRWESSDKSWPWIIWSIVRVQYLWTCAFRKFPIPSPMSWGRLRATMMPWPGLLEPLTECLGLGLVSCVCFYGATGLHPLVFLLPHIVVWLCLDILLICAVKHHAVSDLRKLFLAWLLREFWTIPLFVAGVWSREVAWKGQRYRLHLGGKATKLD